MSVTFLKFQIIVTCRKTQGHTPPLQRSLLMLRPVRLLTALNWLVSHVDFPTCPSIYRTVKQYKTNKQKIFKVRIFKNSEIVSVHSHIHAYTYI